MPISVNRRKVSACLYSLLDRERPTNCRYDDFAPSRRLEGEYGGETMDFAYHKINLIIDCAMEKEVVAEYMAALISIIHDEIGLIEGSDLNVVYWQSDTDWQTVTMGMNTRKLREVSDEMPLLVVNGHRDVYPLLHRLHTNPKYSDADLTLFIMTGNIYCSNRQDATRILDCNPVIWLLKDDIELAALFDKHYRRDQIVLSKYTAADDEQV